MDASSDRHSSKSGKFSVNYTRDTTNPISLSAIRRLSDFSIIHTVRFSAASSRLASHQTDRWSAGRAENLALRIIGPLSPQSSERREEMNISMYSNSYIHSIIRAYNYLDIVVREHAIYQETQLRTTNQKE